MNIKKQIILDDKDYERSLPPLRINDVYDEWRCYASDGECFGHNLEERAKHESKL